jgi:hypothetical protein
MPSQLTNIMDSGGEGGEDECALELLERQYVN